MKSNVDDRKRFSFSSSSTKVLAQIALCLVWTTRSLIYSSDSFSQEVYNEQSLQMASSFAAPNMVPALVEEQEEENDTSVIILTSLIPSHPSTQMIEDTIASLQYLKGLSPNAPIYIGVDGIPEKKALKFPNKVTRLTQYVANLKEVYKNRPNIHIAASPTHLHIAGNINQTVALVDTKYVYVLQHDFPFIRDIDHTNLAKSMSEYPDIIRCVKFNWKAVNEDTICKAYAKDGSTPADHMNGLDFYLTTKCWSDK